ncbi:MAG: hypothetical protein WDM91_12365 [Rhizomicrobium sp.]
MAQNANVLSQSSFPPAVAYGGLAASSLRGGDAGPTHRLSELIPALDVDALSPPQWDIRTSLRFVVVSCGLFWIACIAAFWMLY